MLYVASTLFKVINWDSVGLSAFREKHSSQQMAVVLCKTESTEGTSPEWRTLKGQYLFNAFNLATVFRAKFLEALRQSTLTLPDAVPKKWVVDCQHVGRGLPAIKYLSRYLYRGIVSEKNIISGDGTNVTFPYRESQSGDWKTRCVKGEHFIWLVFQHALPKGFRRVKDFGFLHGNAKTTLRRIQILLKVFCPL